MAGGECVGFDNSAFLGYREVADRYYVLSYYMQENKCFPKGSNIKDTLDLLHQVTIQYYVAKGILSYI